MECPIKSWAGLWNDLYCFAMDTWLQTTEKQAQSEPWMEGSHSVQGMGLRRVMTTFGGLAKQHQVKPCLLSRICLNQMGRHKCDQGQVLALSLTSCAP